MKFKAWLEIVEPTKPLGKVRKSHFVKDQGTNIAKPAIRFSWITKLGNTVKLHFIKEGENEYEVVFYVNDTLYDDASTNTENGRDPEILSGIFYLLKDRADRIGANRLNFRAYESEGDTKILRGLDPNRYKPKALLELSKFSHAIQSYQPKLIQPSQTKIELWKRLGRGHPEPLYDFSKDVWMRLIPNIEDSINNNKRIDGFINELKIAEKFKPLNYDVTSLIEALTDFDNALESNSEQGWRRTRNRRASIYSKLINKIMTDEWDIENNGTRFYLTRKSI